jgi:diadenylate cyclase
MNFPDLVSLLWNNYLVHVVDILLVSYVLYRVILLIRGTRAVQVLIGIIILALLTIVTKQLIKLNTFAWLLGNFWTIGLLMVAIVFQPELRSALAQLGSEPIGRIFLPATDGSFLKELVNAVKELSVRKMGALIVIAQETGLKNYIETGVKIDGEISKELLMSIFSMNSILHDGAVIIKDSRLVAASCILPVSDNLMLNKDLGTRHLAAIGITEISDSIVIVVSEETGTVSLVNHRKLEYNIALDELHKKLKDMYREKLRRKIINRETPYMDERNYVQKI